jgi:antitoxin PrlF
LLPFFRIDPKKTTLDKVRNIPYLSAMTRTSEEVSKITSKGQTTVPKSVRMALGVGAGDEIAFRVDGNRVFVTRLEKAHRDPALGAFLVRIEQDIAKGRNVHTLPSAVVTAMKKARKSATVDLNEPLVGDVAL